MDRQLAPGMERLVAEDGGGVELPSLFGGIMTAAYKKKSITLEDAERTLNPAIHHPERMQHLYGTATEEEGVAACLRAVIGQLVLRKLLKESPDGAWLLGDEFVTDQWLDVLEGEPDDWMRVIVWSQTSDKPSPKMLRDRAREKSRAAIKALAARLEPEGPGLRLVNPKVVKGIIRDYKERGLVEERPEFKVLLDHQGRIIDGRHRIAAAKELGIAWPEERIEQDLSDEEILRIAIQRNRSHKFENKLLKSLADKGLTWINAAGKREMIRLELLTDHERTNREIARLVGCDDKTVAEVRRELEQTAESERIPQFTPIDGQRKDEALRAKVRAALEENPQRSNNATARIVGCNHHLVADVRADLEAEQKIESHRARAGRKKQEAPVVRKPRVERPHKGPDIDKFQLREIVRQWWDREEHDWKPDYSQLQLHRDMRFPDTAKGNDARLMREANREIGRFEAEGATITTADSPAIANVPSNAAQATVITEQVKHPEEPQAQSSMPHEQTATLDPYATLAEEKWQEFMSWPPQVRDIILKRACPQH